MEIGNLMTIDEKVRSGKPVVEGTRVPVDLILGKLAGGMTYYEVMAEYQLAKEDILAVLDYATEHREGSNFEERHNGLRNRDRAGGSRPPLD